MTISISGTVYSDEGVTPDLSGLTVAVSVNGAAAAGTTVSSVVDGSFTILAITAASGAVLTIYLQGNTPIGVRVTLSDGNNLSAANIFENYLIVAKGNAATPTGTNIHTSVGNGASGITAVYSSASTSAFTTTQGTHLYVPAGTTFPTITTLTVGGSLRISGTISQSFGSTINLVGTGSYTVKTSGGTLGAVVVNGSGGTYTLADALVTANLCALTLTAGTLDVSASNLGITLGGNWNNGGGTFVARGGTVTFNRPAGTSSITSGTSSFYSIQCESDTVQMAAALTVTGILAVSSDTTLDLNGNNLTATGATVSNLGTINLVGGETVTGFTNDSTHGTVSYSGDGVTSYGDFAAGSIYNNLTIQGSGNSWQPTVNITINGTFTIAAGTLDMSSHNKNISVAGNWNNSDTFTAGTGTVTLNGTNQTIFGSTTFYNLTKTVSSADTLTFNDGTTQTVSNALTLHGASGQLLTLAGYSTGGWTVAVPATQMLSYLSVSYSTATGNTAAAGSTSTDGGNNTNWTFSSGQNPVGSVLRSIGIGRRVGGGILRRRVSRRL